jgi:TDG/mug DNA glycosylase family protein
MDDEAPEVLDDVLQTGLQVVFCGTAAGARSALLRHPYAGPGNKFWATIHQVGLTDDLLVPSDHRKLANFGLGLTDVAKRASGADSLLSSGDFDVPRLRDKLIEFSPRVLAFNGKRAASVFCEVPTRKLRYGLQSDSIGATKVWVLPSTSGSACRYWDIAPWQELADSRLRSD